MQSLEEASAILKRLVRIGHMRTIEGGGMLLEAQVDPNIVLKLCLWESHCEDCEVHEEMGDGAEAWVDELEPALEQDTESNQ